MALTTQQLISLGFKPSKRSSLYAKKYDSLVYPINNTDFVYTGYNQFSNKINNKILWKSFKQVETGERITYPVVHLGDTGYNELKSYLQRSMTAAEYGAEMAVEEGSMPREIESPATEDEIKATTDIVDNG